MPDVLTDSEQPANQSAVLAQAVLKRTKIGYVGEVRYFGYQLWVRAWREGDDIRMQLLDGRPE